MKDGPLFAGPEDPPAGKALVYIYWPSDGGGNAKRVWVAADQFSEEIRRGGFMVATLPPGQTSLFASVQWDLALGAWGSVGQEGGGMKLDARANQVHYVRIEQGTRLGLSRFDFLVVEPVVAGLEIRKCRRMVPVI